MQQPGPFSPFLVMAPDTYPWDGLACRHVEGHTCPPCPVCPVYPVYPACVYAAECIHILQGISASPLHPQRDSYSGECPMSEAKTTPSWPLPCSNGRRGASTE